MRRKGLIVVMLCAMALAMMGIGTAQATWYSCTLNYVSSNLGIQGVQVTDSTGTRWLSLDSTQGAQNQMLATLLTAMSAGNTVNINVDDASATIFGVNIGR